MPPLTLRGIVSKAGFMNKTATVTVSRMVPHKQTGKIIERSKKYLVHDEANELRQQDRVMIQNCRPLSARKRFKLFRIVESPQALREETLAKAMASTSSNTASTSDASAPASSAAPSS